MRNKSIFTALIAAFCFSIAISQQTALMLTGEVGRDDFMAEPYNSWFNTNYDEYEIDVSDFKLLKKNLKKTKIVVFLGTWCGDTRREVPRFIRILDEIEFDKKRIKYIAIDRSKSAPGYDPGDYDIQYVPTFIFYKKGREYGRIIESPVESLEKDMLNILSKKKKIK
jgi:thiol-disulfide isomerase/thioredoxin